MNGGLDQVLVGAVVAASVAYSAYALGPRGWRRGLAAALAALSARLGPARRARRRTAAGGAGPNHGGGCAGGGPPRRADRG